MRYLILIIPLLFVSCSDPEPIGEDENEKGVLIVDSLGGAQEWTEDTTRYN